MSIEIDNFYQFLKTRFYSYILIDILNIFMPPEGGIQFSNRLSLCRSVGFFESCPYLYYPWMYFQITRPRSPAQRSRSYFYFKGHIHHFGVRCIFLQYLDGFPNNLPQMFAISRLCVARKNYAPIPKVKVTLVTCSFSVYMHVFVSGL